MVSDTSSPSPLYELAGREIGGRYELTRPLAHGGMAAVWEANDLVLGRQVAAKILHSHLLSDEQVVRRFRAEAIAAARLSDPSIVSIYDTIAEPGIEAIVMELVRGPTLREYLDRNAPLTPELAVDIGSQIADALTVAHDAGIVHRDIKPANILLGDDGQLRVTDFGIAKALDATQHTRQGALLGTAKYIAPEQVAGEPVDGRADIYSLATVLYEALTGRVPFDEATALATANARLDRQPLRPRQVRIAVPKDLDAVITRSLGRDPLDRYATIRDFRAALVATTDDSTVADLPDPTELGGAPEPPKPPFHRSERRWLVPAAVILLIGGCLGLATLLIGQSDAGRDLVRQTGERLGIVGEDDGATGPETINTTGEGAAPDVEPIETGELDVAPVASLLTFDPFGTGAPGENDELLDFLVDGDPATAWRTEGYATPDFGAIKPGLGIIVELDGSTEIAGIEVVTPSPGWRADIHLAAAPAAELGDWGAPVASATFDATTSVGVGETAGAILVWITDLGPANQPSRVEIGELRVVTD